MDKKKYEYLAGKIAPTQKEYRSKAAENGERISPAWMPDDIGTENFDKSSGTAYLRKIKQQKKQVFCKNTCFFINNDLPIQKRFFLLLPHLRGSPKRIFRKEYYF